IVRERRLLAAVMADRAFVLQILKEHTLLELANIDLELLEERVFGEPFPADEELLAPVIATLPEEDQAVFAEAAGADLLGEHLRVYTGAFDAEVIEIAITEE